MSEIVFTSDEVELLQELFVQRRRFYDFHLKELRDEKFRRKFTISYINPLISVSDKMVQGGIEVYTEREKLICRSCINEHILEFNNKFDFEEPLDWLSLSNERKEIVNRIDLSHDILLKCKAKDKKLRSFNTKFRFRNTLDALERLKKSETIFLSGLNDVYKIAFVNEDAFLTFELKSSISIYEIKFSAYAGKSIADYGKQYFSLTTDKEHAKKLLSTCDPKYYPSGVLEFISAVLN
jgi:hypothetical protein